jgi:hypothetical protein
MRAGDIRETPCGGPTAKSLKMLRSCGPLGSANITKGLAKCPSSVSRLCPVGQLRLTDPILRSCVSVQSSSSRP